MLEMKGLTDTTRFNSLILQMRTLGFREGEWLVQVPTTQKPELEFRPPASKINLFPLL